MKTKIIYSLKCCGAQLETLLMNIQIAGEEGSLSNEENPVEPLGMRMSQSSPKPAAMIVEDDFNFCRDYDDDCRPLGFFSSLLAPQ